MPQVIYTESSDEIVDLIDKVRNAPDPEVALVLNPGTTGMQTPLNVRLLRQLGTRAGKTVSVISGDPYIQELSRVGGLPTYASVPAFERGIQTVRPHGDDGPTGVATAVAVPPGVAPSGPPPPPGAAVAAAPSARAGAAAGRRRPLYFVAAALVLLGLLLLLVVAPSAKVTITLTGTPLTANPTIQGSPDPTNAAQPDHLVTSVVTSDQSSQFTATPTGKQQVPAAAATATLVFQSKYKSLFPYSLQVNANQQFNTADNPPLVFIYTGTQPIQVQFPANDGSQYQSGSPSVPVQAADVGAKWDVGVGAIKVFTTDPCADPNNPYSCKPGDFIFGNPNPATGGADAKTNTIASSSDVNGWTSQVTSAQQTLTAQVNQDLQSKAAGKTLAKDPGGNGVSVTCAPSPALPAANAVYSATQITVACHGKAATYNSSDVTNIVKADLQHQVAQGDTLATDAINCTKTAVTQAADDGTVVLSVQCTSFSRPAIDLNSLKGQITGHSPGDARNIIQHRFNHVKSVVVSQSPIPLFWLPFFSSRIEIDEATST